jgi:hypothetical protein
MMKGKRDKKRAGIGRKKKRVVDEVTSSCTRIIQA